MGGRDREDWDGPGGHRPDDNEAIGERRAVSDADGLVLVAEKMLSAGPTVRARRDIHQIVVHVDAATLDRGEDGACQLEQGPALHPETARRLACDASVVRILERDGRPLSVGRRTRTVPPALRRALRSRDRSCRFPGCCQRRFLHVHHIAHWAHGGPTDLANWCSCARTTIAWSTRAATGSNANPLTLCASAARTAGHSSPRPRPQPASATSCSDATGCAA